LIVGKTLDSKGSLKIHSVGVFINTLLTMARPFIYGAPQLYANNIAATMNSPAYDTPFVTNVYEKARKSESVSDFLIYREVILHLSRVLILGALCPIIVITGSWKWVFY